jgi:hypothetical protein
LIHLIFVTSFFAGIERREKSGRPIRNPLTQKSDNVFVVVFFVAHRLLNGNEKHTYVALRRTGDDESLASIAPER